jgi:transcriptional regulator with XRE-family HTH domain
MKRIGGRIKSKRESLNLSLNEVAKKAGISSSALSQIENAKAFPSIVTLKSIADVLHSTVGELVGENEVITKIPLVRNAEKIFVERNASGAELFLLSHREHGKQMSTYLIVLKKNATTEGFLKEHSGQEFCHLLKGEVEFEIDETIYKVKSGDSLYYNSAKTHKAINLNSSLAELLFVVTPADF